MGDIEGRVKFLEEMRGEQKEDIQELRKEIKQLPGLLQSVIKTEVQSAIQWCRKHPRKLKKQAAASPESPEDKAVSTIWQKAVVTGLVLILSAAAAWFQNANAGGVKDAPNKQITSQSQDK